MAEQLIHKLKRREIKDNEDHAEVTSNDDKSEIDESGNDEKIDKTQLKLPPKED